MLTLAANAKKLFTDISYLSAKQARVFVLGRLFQLCLMFAHMAGSHPREGSYLQTSDKAGRAIKNKHASLYDALVINEEKSVYFVVSSFPSE